MTKTKEQDCLSDCDCDLLVVVKQ